MQTLVRTPLFEEHLHLNARMVPFAGFEMPVQYEGIIEEHTATRESVGIFDVSHMAEFRVCGQGSYEFLQHMLTNDISKIDDVGAAQYSLMLNDEGGIIDDLIVYHTGLEYLIIANASNREKDFAWLEKHCPDDVELVDESDRTALIAVQGPKALAVLKELAPAGWEPPKRFYVGDVLLDGAINALVARTGYTGEDGVELVVRADDAVAVWRLLLSFPEVNPVGLGARDTLRLEMGYHLYGNDMDESRNPIEAGLGWVCPSAKVGYRGSEAVIAARANGVDEKLTYFIVEGGIPRSGYPIYCGDEQVGTVGSGGHSPSLGYGLATGYVPTELLAKGATFTIGIRKKLLEAQVAKVPFLKK